MKISLSNQSKVLFIALTGIGNVIMLTPALANIKKNFPKSKVTVLIDSYTKDVLKNNKDVDEILIYPARKNLFSRLLFLLKLRGEKFDVCFYSYPNYNIMSAFLSYLTGARYRVNFYYKFMWKEKCGFLNTISVNADNDTHDVDKNLNLLKACNLGIYSKNMIIPATKEDKTYVDTLLKGKVKKSDTLIGVHIGSDDLDKIWKTNNFAALVEEITERGNIKVILVGAAKEKSLVEKFSEFNSPKVVNLMGRTTIPQTTEVIKRCKIFVANDSAPMHMAVVAGTKVISIFIASDFRRTGPYGKEHIVLTNLKEYIGSKRNKNIIYVDKVTPNVIYQQIKKFLR